MNIAIDGPSGAGKSTIARELAAKLNIAYLDTGAMYRAVAVKADRQGLVATDRAAVVAMLPSTSLFITYGGGNIKVLLDGKDISKDIREHRISKYASDVSAIEEVRVWLVEKQREIAKMSSCILDGRDIGTYVLPSAKFKFYLTASIDVRAKRRFDQLQEKGESPDIATIKSDIEKRDYNDMNRAFAPLAKAADAIEIDSSNLSIEQVLSLIMSHIS